MCAGRAGKDLSSSFHFFFCCGRASGNLHAEPHSFPVAPEAVLTRTHCIKGRPHENLLSPFPACPVTLTSFLPSLSSPLKNNQQGLGTSLMQNCIMFYHCVCILLHWNVDSMIVELRNVHCRPVGSVVLSFQRE